jgi:uncharacterized membrane protein
VPLIIGFLVFVLVVSLDEEAAMFLGLAAALVTHYFSSRSSLKSIQAELSALRRQVHQLTSATAVEENRASGSLEKPAATQSEIREMTQPEPASAPHVQPPARESVSSELPPASQDNLRQPEPVQQPKFVAEPNMLDKAWNAIWSVVKNYFTDGNLFVRIGILILFAGVSFLLKYAAEHSHVPIEARISVVALAGLGLLYFGWRKRQSKGVYALLVQGAGIGIMYMSIFAAYKIYELLPSSLTFILLAGLAIFSALLAVAQDSKALAAFGITGGFLAPILASSGSGNYVALFSYYIFLDLGVLAIAWFKSWRIVNVLAFGFTYLAYTVWMFNSYRSEYVISADVFLIAFFLIFSIASVLFALRQPLQLKGYVDGTLVFGNPLIAWGLQMMLMRNVEYGIATSAFIFGFYHVVLARLLWNRHNEGVKLFSEALLSVGVIFLTLAIPYSMDGHWTSATWALEGAGILWISLRQERKLAQYFAMLLQLASALVFLIQYRSDPNLIPVINAYYLGGVIIAVSGFFSAWQLYKRNIKSPGEILPNLHSIVFVWSMLWWVAINLSQIDLYVHAARGKAQMSLVLVLATSILAWQLAKRLGWKLAEITSLASIAGFILIGAHAIIDFLPPIDLIGTALWFMALAYTWWLLAKIERTDTYTNVIVPIHTAVILLAAALLNAEVIWLLDKLFPGAGEGWKASYWFITPAVVLFDLLRAQHWPLLQFNGRVKKSVIGFGLAYLVIWSLAVNLTNNGNPEPLLYLPVLNPVDVMHVFMLVLGYRCYQLLKPDVERFAQYRELKSIVTVVVAVLVFIWINAILLRSIHHFAGVAYHPSALAHSALVQAALSILWTILGMLAMLFAARKSLRKFWIAGAVLVGVVLVKLVLIDLSSRDTIERIVSFIAVGLLLVGMGYFSPIPEKQKRN